MYSPVRLKKQITNVCTNCRSRVTVDDRACREHLTWSARYLTLVCVHTCTLDHLRIAGQASTPRQAPGRHRAETQPQHVPRPRSALGRITILAGHVQHAFGHGPVEQRAGQPRVDRLPASAATRTARRWAGPTRCRRSGPETRRPRRAWPRSSRDSPPAAARRAASKSPRSSTVAIRTWLKCGEPKSMFPFSASTRPDQRRRQDAPAHADARRKRLGKGAGVDHGVAFRIERPQAGHVVARVAQLAVGGVFDQVDLVPSRPAFGDLDQRRAGARAGASRRWDCRSRWSRRSPSPGPARRPSCAGPVRRRRPRESCRRWSVSTPTARTPRLASVPRNT